MSNVTMMTDVLNPQVLADMVSAKLPTASTLLRVFETDNTLEGQPGNEITLPKWNYIGDAEDRAEGAEGDSAKLTHTTQKAKVKKAVKDVEMTDEVKLSAYGNPEVEIPRQLMGSVAGKVSTDIIAALGTTSLTVTGELTEALIQDANDKLVVDLEQEGQDFQRYLLASRDVVSGLRRIKAIQSLSNAGETAIIKGVVGEIDGSLVLPVDRLPAKTAYAVKGDAVKIYLKRKCQIEYDRLVKKKTDLYSIDQHYVAVLHNGGSAVKITVTP